MENGLNREQTTDEKNITRIKVFIYIFIHIYILIYFSTLLSAEDERMLNIN